MAAVAAVLDFGLIFCDSYLQIAAMLPTKFRINWLFGLGVQNTFSKTEAMAVTLDTNWT